MVAGLEQVVNGRVGPEGFDADAVGRIGQVGDGGDAESAFGLDALEPDDERLVLGEEDFEKGNDAGDAEGVERADAGGHDEADGELSAVGAQVAHGAAEGGGPGWNLGGAHSAGMLSVGKARCSRSAENEVISCGILRRGRAFACLESGDQP